VKNVVLVHGANTDGSGVTVAGADPKVRALVYVAALQPDVGETTNQLAVSMPGEVPSSDLKLTKDGFIFRDPTRFAADVGADLPPAQAKYMANSQMPVAAAAFDAPVTVASWRDKPSYGIVATADRALNPILARWMYKRSGAMITEIKAKPFSLHLPPPSCCQRHRKSCPLYQGECNDASIIALASLHFDAAASPRSAPQLFL
jgi:hypothetical protein